MVHFTSFLYLSCNLMSMLRGTQTWSAPGTQGLNPTLTVTSVLLAYSNILSTASDRATGAWLSAVPSVPLGNSLDDDALPISVGPNLRSTHLGRRKIVLASPGIPAVRGPSGTCRLDHNSLGNWRIPHLGHHLCWLLPHCKPGTQLKRDQIRSGWQLSSHRENINTGSPEDEDPVEDPAYTRWTDKTAEDLILLGADPALLPMLAQDLLDWRRPNNSRHLTRPIISNMGFV